jgi:hypothetical protein
MSEPHLVTKAAIGGDTGRVQERLGRFSSYVYQMMDDPEKDRYTRFLALYYAVKDGGALIYFEDFQRRHFERMAATEEKNDGVQGTMDRVIQAQAAFSMAVNNGNDQLIVREGSKLTHAIGEMMAISQKRLQQASGNGRLQRMEKVS